ncbi:MAG TPA: HEAT repeat domain-containing protein [Polyangia bacterium]
MLALVLATLGARPAVAGKLEELSRLLLEDESYKVRVQAAQLLGKLGDRAALGALGKALTDSNKTVRWMAVQSIARLEDPSALPVLRALIAREPEATVRAQAQKAVAALTALAEAAGNKRSGRIFLTFGSFSGGASGAEPAVLQSLRQALQRDLGKLPSVTFEGGDPKSFANSGQLGFFIDGNVSRLDGGGGGSAEINCDVKVMVARWPSKSIILWTNAGAAVTGGSRPQDIANARKDCLEASAGQLAEDLVKFFKSQGG